MEKERVTMHAMLINDNSAPKCPGLSDEIPWPGTNQVVPPLFVKSP